MDTVSTNVVKETQFETLNILLHVIIAILSTFLILNIFHGRHTLAMIEFFLIAICVSSILQLKKIVFSEYSHKSAIAYSCFIAGLWSFMVMLDDVSIMSFVWIFAIPIIMYLINGVRYGFILTVVFTLISLTLFLIKANNINQLTIFSWINLVTVMAVIWGIAHFYESTNISIKRDLQYQSTIDPLTRLKDRTRLYEAYRNHQDKVVSLVILDIDNLQGINERHGHLAGDVVLMTIAKIMKENKSEVAQVFRVDGDEFAILVPDSSCDDCLNMTKAIYKKINNRQLVLKRDPIPINVSMALACLHSDGNNLDNLMIKAEKLLLTAKKQTTDRIMKC